MLHKQANERGNKHKIPTSSEIIGDRKGCVDRINTDKSISTMSIEGENEANNGINEEKEYELPIEILDGIVNRTTVAATDAAIDRCYLATYCVMSAK